MSLLASPAAVALARTLGRVTLGEALVTLRAGVTMLGAAPPLPSDPTADGRSPVVLVHGYMGHPDHLRALGGRLIRAGWGPVVRLGYPSLTWSFEQILAHVDREVRRVEAAHGPVHLIGHSLGALACRAWVKTGGGAAHVRHLVSLGGPHAGTSLYRLVPSPVRAALDPRGAWVRRVNEGPEPVPTTVVRARYDHQVFPPVRARIGGVDEVVVDAWGHNGLLWSAEAHHAILEAMARHHRPDA